MELETKTRLLAVLAHAQVDAHDASTKFGYWEKHRTLPEVVQKINSKTAELIAIAAIGDGPSRTLGRDVSRMEEAIADVIISCLDMGAWQGLSIGPALIKKLDYNRQLSKLCKKDY